MLKNIVKMVGQPCFTLLSIAGKMISRVLLNWLVPTIADEHLKERQYGFRTNKNTKVMVFAFRQLHEKYPEQN